MRQPGVVLARRQRPPAPGAVRLARRHVLRMVVHQHEVEVRAAHHFPRPRLAQRDHAHAAAADRSVALGVLGHHLVQHPHDDALGQRGARDPGPVDVEAPFHLRHRQAELLAAQEAARHPDRLLHPACRTHLPVEQAAQRPVRVPAGVRHQQPVQRPRHRGKVVGQRRRRAEHRGHPLQQRRIAVEQRQQLHQAGLTRQKGVEPDQRRQRVALPPQRLQQRRHQALQQGTRPRLAQRPVPVAVPAAQDVARLVASRLACDGGTERVRQRVVMPPVCIDRPRNNRQPCIPDAARPVLPAHHVGEAAPGATQLRQQAVRQRRTVGDAGEAGERVEPPARRGQAVRLPVRLHLQPVFQGSQPCIGGCQRARGGPVEVAARGQPAQRAGGARIAQRRLAPGPDQLQRLRDELDLAYPAMAELEVVAEQRVHRVVATRAAGLRSGRARRPEPLRRRRRVAVDPALHGMDVLDGGEVEVPAPHERPDRLQEPPAAVEVARHRARLDHRRPFPGFAVAFVVCDRRRQRDGGRRGAGIGTQPQVHPEHEAVRVRRFHQPDQPGRQAHEHPARLRHRRVRRRVVQQHQVDVAGIVQLARAELAHRQHHEPAFPFRPVRMRQDQQPGVMRVVQQVRRRHAQRGVRQQRQGAGHALEVPQPAEVGDRHRQRHLPPGPPEPGCDRAPLRVRPQGAQPAQRRRRRALRPVQKQLVQEPALAPGEVGQEHAVAAEAGQQRVDGRCLRQGRPLRRGCPHRLQQRRRAGRVRRTRPMVRQPEPAYRHVRPRSRPVVPNDRLPARRFLTGCRSAPTPELRPCPRVLWLPAARGEPWMAS